MSKEINLFLQTMAHRTVHIIARAKELHDIVLRVTRNKINIVLLSVHAKHAATQELRESDVPPRGTASDELSVRYTHPCAGEATGRGAC